MLDFSRISSLNAMINARSPVSNVSTTVVDLGAALDHHPTSSSIPHHLQDETNSSTPSSSDTSPPRKESTFETADGTLHVTPFRKKGSKRLKAIVTFVPRASTFDRENPQSGSDQFRGFFTLFWISVRHSWTSCGPRPNHPLKIYVWRFRCFS